MIIGGRTAAADRGDIGSFTQLSNRGVGTGFTAHGLGHLYNGHLFVLRTNSATFDLSIYDYTAKSVIWSEADNLSNRIYPMRYGKYLYVPYNLQASKKFTIRKIDLSDGSETTIWTDGTANDGGVSCHSGSAWDITEGKIAFHFRGAQANRRIILTVDLSDDSTNVLITDTFEYLGGIACDSSYIYYVDGTTLWRRMEWDGANKLTMHTAGSMDDFSGPNGLHQVGVGLVYDVDATNLWNFGGKILSGFFLTNSMPYYFVGYDSNDTVKVYKLATGSSLTVLETLSGSYDLNHGAGPYFAPYENFEGLAGISYALIGTDRSVLITFPDREHN